MVGMSKPLETLAGPRYAWNGPARSALSSALRHKHRIDDVNDAILLVDVGDRHDGLAAFRVDDFESEAIVPHGQLFALDGFVRGLTAALLDCCYEIGRGNLAGNDVVGENGGQCRLISGLQKRFDRPLGQLLESLVHRRENRERSVALQGFDEIRRLDCREERRVILRIDRVFDDVRWLSGYRWGVARKRALLERETSR